MTISLDLPSELENELSAEASQLKLPLPEYILVLPELPWATATPSVVPTECVNKNETKNKRELVWNRLAARSRHWWIDPNGRGYHGWAGRVMDKALRMGEISRG